MKKTYLEIVRRNRQVSACGSSGCGGSYSDGMSHGCGSGGCGGGYYHRSGCGGGC